MDRNSATEEEAADSLIGLLNIQEHKDWEKASTDYEQLREKSYILE
jgi:hypothetical protein